MFKNRLLQTVLILLGALAALTGLYIFAFHPWMVRMGASETEVNRRLPGDEIIATPQMSSTRAITIRAPVEQVWPWIIQMGQGRGGLYSYEELENMVGCNIHNANQILPQFQTFTSGEKFRLGPDGYPFYNVMGVETGRTLILGGKDPQSALGSSWVFYLETLDSSSTRLIIRSRGSYQPDLGSFITWRVITEPLSFMMEQKMLRGIRDRAEGQPVPWW